MRDNHVQDIGGAAQKDDDQGITARGCVVGSEGKARHPCFGWDLVQYRQCLS
jgi:hypothetical protein